MLDKVLDYLTVQVVAIVPEHCHSTSIHVHVHIGSGCYIFALHSVRIPYSANFSRGLIFAVFVG